MNESNKASVIKLPKGCLSGNCSDCIHYNPYNKDANGGYCSYYGTHYWPEQRNGCFNYKSSSK